MVEGGEWAENGRCGLLWIVMAAAMEWNSWDGLPWWGWGWVMMKERSLRMERGDRKRGVERIEEEKMAFKEEMRISHKVMGSAKISHSCGSPRQRAWFWKLVTKANSHKVRIPVIFALRFWEGPRACFLKICHKREFAQGDVLCENFAQGEWVVRILLCLGFSPLFSLVFILQAFLPTC